jgi:transcription initiation factor TFIIB
MVITDKTQDVATPEWRAYTTEEKNEKARTGSPTSLAVHDMGLSTVIGRANRDAGGQIFDVSMRSTIERLRTWDSRIEISDRLFNISIH